MRSGPGGFADPESHGVIVNEGEFSRNLADRRRNRGTGSETLAELVLTTLMTSAGHSLPHLRFSAPRSRCDRRLPWVLFEGGVWDASMT
jgi:hypothetical protein